MNVNRRLIALLAVVPLAVGATAVTGSDSEAAAVPVVNYYDTFGVEKQLSTYEFEGKTYNASEMHSITNKLQRSGVFLKFDFDQEAFQTGVVQVSRRTEANYEHFRGVGDAVLGGTAKPTEPSVGAQSVGVQREPCGSYPKLMDLWQHKACTGRNVWYHPGRYGRWVGDRYVGHAFDKEASVVAKSVCTSKVYLFDRRDFKGQQVGLSDRVNQLWFAKYNGEDWNDRVTSLAWLNNACPNAQQ